MHVSTTRVSYLKYSVAVWFGLFFGFGVDDSESAFGFGIRFGFVSLCLGLISPTTADVQGLRGCWRTGPSQTRDSGGCHGGGAFLSWS